jgi:hypothetical protein
MGGGGPTLIDIRYFQRLVVGSAIIGFWGVMAPLSAQAPAPRSDIDQINDLMAALSNHSKTPADVLDPNLRPPDRIKSLSYFRTTNFELSFLPTEDMPPITRDVVSVPVRVHFDGKDGNTLDTDTTAQFVKRGRSWYFSNFDFMAWPVILIVVFVGSILLIGSYATFVLLLWKKLSRKGQIGANAVKVLLPFYWPSLLRQTR